MFSAVDIRDLPPAHKRAEVSASYVTLAESSQSANGQDRTSIRQRHRTTQGRLWPFYLPWASTSLNAAVRLNSAKGIGSPGDAEPSARPNRQ